MTTPQVLSEDETMDAAVAGRSIARYGDGELRIALGGSSASQKPDKRLAIELTTLLAQTARSLVCIPNCVKTAKPKNWAKYNTPQYTRMYRRPPYGSAFITRPDSAPWIDRPDYWEKVRSIWRDRDIVLVAGSERSLTVDRMPEARSVRLVQGTYRDSYDVIDRLVEETGTPSGPVIICLGAAGTVLAERLARKGAWALDLGHIGMMMKSAGRWSIQPEQLLSPGYRAAMVAEHKRSAWGKAGKSHADTVVAWMAANNCKSVLDYGCGTGSLGIVLRERGIPVDDYDPGIPGKDGMPPFRDMVVCTDVMEHVEEGRVDNVLRHLANVTRKAAFFVISLNVSERTLIDGRNAHLTVRDHSWWLAKVKQVGFKVHKHEIAKGLRIWATK